MKINSWLFIITLVVFSCKQKTTNAVVFFEGEKIIIQETTSLYLNRYIDWIADKDEQFIYISSNENQILQLNTQNGALLPFYEMDSTKVNHLYKEMVQHYSGIDFKYSPDELANEYTLIIDRLWLANDTLFANLTLQFSVNGSYYGRKARHVLFFGTVLQFDIKNNQLIDTYFTPQEIISDYDSLNDTERLAYLSGQRSFAYHNNAFYFGNAVSTNFDSLKLLIKIPHNYLTKIQNDSTLHKINIADFLIDLKTIDKNSDGRLFFYNTHAVTHKNKLYFSEGKNVYDIEEKIPYVMLIDSSYQHLNTFDVLPSGNVLYVTSKDTVNDKNLVYYDVVKKAKHSLKKIGKDVKKVLIGKKYFYELFYEDEKYYLVKYRYEEE